MVHLTFLIDWQYFLLWRLTFFTYRSDFCLISSSVRFKTIYYISASESFSKKHPLNFPKSTISHIQGAELELSSPPQKFSPPKNDSKWHKMSFWVIFGRWKFLRGDDNSTSAPCIENCGLILVPNPLTSFHLCLHAAGTKFGTDQTSKDVYELGLSYLSISIFRSHSLNFQA